MIEVKKKYDEFIRNNNNFFTKKTVKELFPEFKTRFFKLISRDTEPNINKRVDNLLGIFDIPTSSGEYNIDLIVFDDENKDKVNSIFEIKRVGNTRNHCIKFC